MADLSREALEAYRFVAQITDTVDSPEFTRRLALMGLLSSIGETVKPNRSGILLFGKEPRLILQQAGLLATIKYSDNTEEVRDFDGPQVLVPEQVLKWLLYKLPNPIDRSEARRRDMNTILFELVREGVVNALVHRDYSIPGAKCQLIVTSLTLRSRENGEE